MHSSTLVSIFVVKLHSIIGSVQKPLLVKAKLIQTQHTPRHPLFSHLQAARWERSGPLKLCKTTLITRRLIKIYL